MHLLRTIGKAQPVAQHASIVQGTDTTIATKRYLLIHIAPEAKSQSADPLPNRRKKPSPYMAVIPFHNNLAKVSHRYYCVACDGKDFTCWDSARNHADKTHQRELQYSWICVCDGAGFQGISCLEVVRCGELLPNDLGRELRGFSSIGPLKSHQAQFHPCRKLEKKIKCSCGMLMYFEEDLDAHKGCNTKLRERPKSLDADGG